MTELSDAAARYADDGLHLLALSGKTPNTAVHRHWSREDSLRDDRDALYRAMTHPKTTGIGILTGYPVFVVDIDGPEGARHWLEMVGEDAYIPDTWVAQTGRGMHLYFHDVFERWPTTQVADKLDFKGVGGYVAAPPSLHPSGARYSWLRSPDEAILLQLPDAMHDYLARVREMREQSLLNKAMRRPVAVEDRKPGLIYNEVTFDGIFDAVREAAEGNRNNVLFWAAATMRDEGAGAADFATLQGIADEIGLTKWESRRTIESAMKARP